MAEERPASESFLDLVAEQPKGHLKRDVDAILARKPEIAVVDELPHANLAGSKHEKR